MFKPYNFSNVQPYNLKKALIVWLSDGDSILSRAERLRLAGRFVRLFANKSYKGILNFMKIKNISRKIGIFTLCLLLLAALNCTSGSMAEKTGLPDDIRGIRLNMPKEEAQKRLTEIAESRQEVKKNQQVWTLKDDPNFSHIMVGYDKQDKVRYVTTTVEKKYLKFKEPVKFSEIGNLDKAKKETVENRHKYMWDIGDDPKNPVYRVSTYGEDGERLVNLSISRFIKEK